jgi:shikimate kinase
LKLPKTLSLVGMMGAGKTAIGRRLAARLNIPFVDADDEIETAAGRSIEDIFAKYGETEFRQGEYRVIDRLLNDPLHVLATGGGAFINAETRRELRRRSISLWLRADLDVLWHRVNRRSDRPMLKTPDPRGTLAKLIETRYPFYAEADITVDSVDGPPEEIVDNVLCAIESFLHAHGDKA